MLDVKEKAKELGQVFSRKQIIEYMRFQDHRYALKRAFLGGEVQTAIMRAVTHSELEHERGINAASIAASVDVPRETVRRHLAELTKEGWLVKEGGDYRAGPLVDEHFGVLEGLMQKFIETAKRMTHLGQRD